MSPQDADLIDQVRDGDVSAYGALYERHVDAAYALARHLTRSPADADDLVSESFARVLGTLRAGRGPDVAFRPYLLTTVRHTAYDRSRRDRRVQPTDEIDTAEVEPFVDPAVAELERTLAARAFRALPERWQAVLWYTEVENLSPAQVAPLLGLTANGITSLAYRAREGLRQAYLQVHLADTDTDTEASAACHAVAGQLGAWTRSGLAGRERNRVAAHLRGCARCHALAEELATVNQSLRVVLAPLVLGAAAAGYLAVAGNALDVTRAATGPNVRQVLGVVTAAAVAAGAVLAALLLRPDDDARPAPTPPPITTTTR